MTQLDRAAKTVRPRSPLPLILGLVAVAIAVVVVFATGGRDDAPEPAGPVPAPVMEDSAVEGDSLSGAEHDPVPAADPSPRTPPAHPDSSQDSAGRTPRDTSDSARPPIGDPGALPRPPVTLPRPERDSSGDRP